MVGCTTSLLPSFDGDFHFVLILLLRLKHLPADLNSHVRWRLPSSTRTSSLFHRTSLFDWLTAAISRAINASQIVIAIPVLSYNCAVVMRYRCSTFVVRLAEILSYFRKGCLPFFVFVVRNVGFLVSLLIDLLCRAEKGAACSKASSQ